MQNFNNAELSKVRLNKIRWRAKRGMLELDLLLKPFIKERLQSLNFEEIELLEKLLEIDDPILLEMLHHQNFSNGNEKFSDLIKLINSCNLVNPNKK